MPTLKELDSWPTNVVQQTRLQEAIHEKHWEERKAVVEALADGYYKDLVGWAQRISSCGQTVRFYLDPDDRSVRPWLHRCKHRLCPWCARVRTAQVADMLEEAMRQFRRPRMMVLTVRSEDRPLADQLTLMRDAFKRLRRKAEWLKYVVGGVYVIEITLNLKTRLWHPHIHLIFDGQFFPQRQLSAMWEKVTGGSKIAWVLEVSDRRGAAVELAKYLGKPAHLEDFTAAEVCEYAKATSGSRMAQSFGAYRRLKVHDAVDLPQPGPDQWSVSLPRIMHLAKVGHVGAIQLVHLIAQRWRIFASYIWHWAPQLAPPTTQADKLRKLMAFTRCERAPPDLPAETVAGEKQLDAQIFAAFSRLRVEDDLGKLDWWLQQEAGD